MNSKDLAALNALRGGQQLAASVPATAASCLAWVGVYPLNLERETTRSFLKNRGQIIPALEARVYRVRLIEVDRRLVEEDVSVSETDITNRFDEIAYGDDQLITELNYLGVELGTLALPYKSDYPI